MLILIGSWWRTRWSLAIISVVAVGTLVVVFRARLNDAPSVATDRATNEVAQTDGANPTRASTDEVPVIAKPPIDVAHPLYVPLQAAYNAREALNEVQDYEAVFSKRELMGRKLVSTTMNLKLRHEPFSVYLKFVEPKANAGREVIYVKGLNDDNLLVRDAGFAGMLGTNKLLPTGSLAMSDNRYPVTMIGLRTMLDKVIRQWEAEAKFDEVETKEDSDAVLPTGEACVVYEALHPTPREHFKFHITRLWIDKQTHLAIRVEQLGFPPTQDKAAPVIEEYTYGKVQTNVHLGDEDFDVKNKKYGFQR